MVTSTLKKLGSTALACVLLAACGDGASGTAAKDSASPGTTTSAARSASPVASTSATPSATSSVAAATPSATDSAAPKTEPSASAVASSGPAPKGPTAGKPWQLVASADADAGYHCNSDYPNMFRTSGGTNVTYPDPKPKGGCAGNRVVVNIPIVPTAAGPGTVVGTLSYGICDDSKTNCQTKKKEVTLTFTAAP